MGQATDAVFLGARASRPLRKQARRLRSQAQALRASLSLSNDPVELARALGIARLSDKARKRLSAALDAAASSER